LESLGWLLSFHVGWSSFGWLFWLSWRLLLLFNWSWFRRRLHRLRLLLGWRLFAHSWIHTLHINHFWLLHLLFRHHAIHVSLHLHLLLSHLVWIVLILIHLIISIHWRHLTDVSSGLSEDIVLLFILLNLLSKVINLHILSLQLLLDVSSVHAVNAHAELIDLELVLLDLLLKCMLLDPLIVDLLQKLNILRHNLRVLLLVDILILLEHQSQVVNVVFQVSSLLSVLFMDVGVSGLVLDLFFHVLFMESNDTSLKLLEISDVVKDLKNIVLELLLVSFLLVKVLSQVFDLGGQTLLSHSEIIHDKSKILIDSVEMLQLLPHDVGLLLELLNFNFSWADISLELLDFVIKNELELLKFLSLLFQVNNSLIFVLDSGLSLTELGLLRNDLLLEIVSALV